MKRVLLLGAMMILPVLMSSVPAVPADEPTVLICTGKYAKKYHKSQCKGLDNCKGKVIKVTLSEAKKQGKTECGYCYK
ncbi:hypothetical protein AGMMS4957_19690 [Bacteroidia bacterium]|nr:hypothetical protein AGMMS4957_19690 [Bacteroidia bacterium]